jgi:hypothetical protein
LGGILSGDRLVHIADVRRFQEMTPHVGITRVHNQEGE